MCDMIKAEREKIVLRKSTRVIFIMGFVIIIGYFFLFHFKYNAVFYNYNTGKMDIENGFVSVKHRKK